jgi:hypothetical protein
MDQNIKDRIRRAVEKGISARKKYYDSIGLPDEQKLGPPSSREEISALEAAIGKPLPPSYRHFLEMFNGWRMIDGGLDLLSVKDLLDGPRKQKISEWQKKMESYGDEVAARSLVIGVSSVTATKYLLDPEVIDPQGEWRFVQHHNGEEAEVASFLEWLEESVDEYDELASMNQDML